jgi:hypothetical protein
LEIFDTECGALLTILLFLYDESQGTLDPIQIFAQGIQVIHDGKPLQRYILKSADMAMETPMVTM